MKILRKYLLTFLISGVSFSSFSKNSITALHPAPVVNFEIDGLCFGDSTTFTNFTQLAQTYLWTICQAGYKGYLVDTIFTSTSFNIKFKFPHKGNYKVSLQANNGHVVVLSRVLNIDTITTAHFDYANCFSQFSNLSTCASSYLWKFGDGDTSTLKNPMHNFAVSGTYNVQLKAMNGSAADSLTLPITTIVNNPTAKFTTVLLNDTVYFNAIDTLFGFSTQY
ncbi:MAG TPA: PKD domain-containing protein, partial [Nitrosopumilaceae archaeon]|nr:PKD domain-containing protein [Nitrosopumilaceae archaeon]